MVETPTSPVASRDTSGMVASPKSKNCAISAFMFGGSMMAGRSKWTRTAKRLALRKTIDESTPSATQDSASSQGTGWGRM